ncbi:MAG: NAD(P)H-hydrate dehydratase [Methylacidiphilales bacterium]|nr:NAD(P)H-hydrate dehydratase [Candidatus Methylacidiphilales bacterium]
MNRQELISQVVVTAQQMRDIEERMFAAGMPVAALMEKVAGLITRHIQVLIQVLVQQLSPIRNIVVLIGPGHNGADALVVARELFLHGYEVGIYCPFSNLKVLTSQHLQYAQSLGIPYHQSIDAVENCDLLIDGLFGFGLERNLGDAIIASDIDTINAWSKPVISIDLPSGLHTDTGEVLGTAIRATHTLCLGLWKLGLLQDKALEYVGKAELIDFGIPWADVENVLERSSKIHRITRKIALSTLPLPRPPVTHKYKEGHLLLICGSRRYAGGAILTGLGARASGVGMLSIAVPESLKSLLVAQLPEALIIGCPETETGAISQLELPANTRLDSFSAIACGPGLTIDAAAIIEQVLASTDPLVIDADGLNILANMETTLGTGAIDILKKRQAASVITPHTGEFKRLFPDIPDATNHRIEALREAAKQSGAIVLLKGARTAIANSDGNVWIVPESTPALARGGSGDVLTGLLGGLLAQGVNKDVAIAQIVATAAWWHAQAGILAAQERTELGVDAYTLTQYLLPVIGNRRNTN